MLGLGGFLPATTEIYYHRHKAANGEALQDAVKVFFGLFCRLNQGHALITDSRIICQFFFISSKPYYTSTLSYIEVDCRNVL